MHDLKVTKNISGINEILREKEAKTNTGEKKKGLTIDVEDVVDNPQV